MYCYISVFYDMKYDMKYDTKEKPFQEFYDFIEKLNLENFESKAKYELKIFNLTLEHVKSNNLIWNSPYGTIELKTNSQVAFIIIICLISILIALLIAYYLYLKFSRSSNSQTNHALKQNIN